MKDVYGFHVLGISETWLNDHIPDRLLNISGYKLYRSDRPKNSKLPVGHGGVAILARESVSVSVLPRPVTESQCHSNLEIIWAKMRTGMEQQFIFATAYRHPTNTVRQISADLDDLNAQLNFMIATHPRCNVVLTGDFNACLLKTGAGTPGAKLREILNVNRLVPVNVKTPTYRPAR